MCTLMRCDGLMWKSLNHNLFGGCMDTGRASATVDVVTRITRGLETGVTRPSCGLWSTTITRLFSFNPGRTQLGLKPYAYMAPPRLLLRTGKAHLCCVNPEKSMQETCTGNVLRCDDPLQCVLPGRTLSLFRVCHNPRTTEHSRYSPTRWLHVTFTERSARKITNRLGFMVDDNRS